jgi:hypothetical protein
MYIKRRQGMALRLLIVLMLCYPYVAEACDDPALLFDNKRLALRIWVLNLPVLLLLAAWAYKMLSRGKGLFGVISIPTVLVAISPGWYYSGMSGDCALGGLTATEILLGVHVAYAAGMAVLAEKKRRMRRE